MNGKFVGYYRVSTQKQGRSGLGLEAQKQAVTSFLNGGRWKLVAEAVEVESGKRSDRPKLQEALSLCRLHRATLLVAKLDRLARNVAFISALMESGVKFVAVDMPEANELTVHVMAAMAEHEAKAISNRTKAALAAAKTRGTLLGGLRWDITLVAAEGREIAQQVRQEKASKFRADVLPMLRHLQSKGVTTLTALAAELNAQEVETPRGNGWWSAVQVSRILKGASTV